MGWAVLFETNDEAVPRGGMAMGFTMMTKSRLLVLGVMTLLAIIGFAPAARAHEIHLDYAALMETLGEAFGTGIYNANSDLDNDGHADAMQENILEAIGILGNEDDPVFLDVHDAYHDNVAIVSDALALVSNTVVPAASKDAYTDLLGLFMTIQGHGGAIAGVSTTGMAGFVNAIWLQFGLTPAFEAAAWVQAEHFESTGHEGEGEGEGEANGRYIRKVGSAFDVTIPDPVGDLQPFQWYKDGLPLVNDGRVTGADARTLSISSLVVNDGGDYTAVYQGHNKHELNYTVHLDVVTRIHQYAAGEPLQFVIPSPIAESLPIEWTKDGEVLDNVDGVQGAGTRVLTIPYLNAGHTGVYNAIYERHTKHQGSFGPVYVQVLPGAQLLTVGDTLSLTIPPPVAASLPAAWYKDGALLADGGRVSGATGITLQVANVGTGDTGVYSAVYERHAKHQGSFEVLVRVVTDIYEAGIGDTFSLTIPQPVEESLPITWFRDGAPMSDYGRVSGTSTRTLVIDDLHITDSGVYSAEYEEHAKHMHTLGPVMLLVSPAGLPLGSAGGLMVLSALLAGAGALHRRRQ